MILSFYQYYYLITIFVSSANNLAQSESFKLHGHTGDIVSLAFLNDGKLASGGLDGLIKIWDGDPNKGWSLVNTIKVIDKVYLNIVKVIALPSLNNQLAVAKTSEITIYDYTVYNGQKLSTLSVKSANPNPNAGCFFILQFSFTFRGKYNILSH